MTSLCKIDSQFDSIAGLCIRKNSAALDVGISIQHASCQSEQTGSRNGV